MVRTSLFLNQSSLPKIFLCSDHFYNQKIKSTLTWLLILGHFWGATLYYYYYCLPLLVPALHQLIGNTIFCYSGAQGGEEN